MEADSEVTKSAVFPMSDVYLNNKLPSSPPTSSLSASRTHSPNQSVLERAQQEFESQLSRTFSELVSSGLDPATAEYTILCRLCSQTSAETVDESLISRYIVDGCLRYEEAIRAFIIQRELDSLCDRGFTLLDSISELILRLHGAEDKEASAVTRNQGAVNKKKKIKECTSNLVVATKNKVRVHRRHESPIEEVVSLKESFPICDGELSRPVKKLRKDSLEKEFLDRGRKGKKQSFKASMAKFNLN